MNQGTTHWNAKLSDKIVQMIRNSPHRTGIVAMAYGVNPRYVRKLRAGHARKSV